MHGYVEVRSDLQVAVGDESFTLVLRSFVQTELWVLKVARINKVFAVHPDRCVFVISDCALLIASSLNSGACCLSVAVNFNFAEEDWVGR